MAGHPREQFATAIHQMTDVDVHTSFGPQVGCCLHSADSSSRDGGISVLGQTGCGSDWRGV